jgi:hypothetical protein
MTEKAGARGVAGSLRATGSAPAIDGLSALCEKGPLPRIGAVLIVAERIARRRTS